MNGPTPNWISQLAPPHAPAAAGWWPLAPGWWALLALLIVAAGVLVYRYQRPAARLRRAALKELALLQAADHLDDGALARKLEGLLRRFAVARFGRDAVAGLAGERWLAFVASHGGKALSGNAGAALLGIAYGGDAKGDFRRDWLTGAQAFVRGAT
jgi:hypothetical protein